MNATVDENLTVSAEGFGRVGYIAYFMSSDSYKLVWYRDWEKLRPLELDALYLALRPTFDLLTITKRLTE